MTLCGSARYAADRRVIHGRDVVLEQQGGTMGRQAGVVLYVLALVTVVVGVDVLFFSHRFWERLTVNVGIVLVFAAFYLRFLKRASAGRPR
jgi:hypothetical protein